MRTFAIAFAAALLLAAPVHAAETCALQAMGTLAITLTPDGAIRVPVKIDGAEQAMALELGTPQSGVSEAFATGLGLHVDHLGRSALVYHGVSIRNEVILPELKFGVVTGTQVPVLLLPQGASLPAGTIGVLGSGLAANADLELDFANGKLNLFAPEHCAGAGVTWSDSAAILPFHRDDMGRIVFTMQLDGKDVTAAFGAQNSGTMPLSIARRVFGVGYSVLTDPHPFKMLSAGGLAIAYPAIRVVDDSNDGCEGHDQPLACFGRPDLQLGLSQIKTLHLFLAFGEGKLYATAADAHK
ncbi:MAG TPA: retropepsin-like aspartic protease [Rhizomicrobium sp.]|nr:retropepsin-like aspartic protease [Rhizomicrobium sp.]